MNDEINHTFGVSANGCDHHTELLTVWLVSTNPDVISLAMHEACTHMQRTMAAISEDCIFE